MKRFLQFWQIRLDEMRDEKPETFHEKLHKRTSLGTLQRLAKDVQQAWKDHGWIRKNMDVDASTRFGIDQDDRLYASNGYYTHHDMAEASRNGRLRISGYMKPTPKGLVYDVYPGTGAWGSNRINPKELRDIKSEWFKRFKRAGIKRGEIEAY